MSNSRSKPLFFLAALVGLALMVVGGGIAQQPVYRLAGGYPAAL